MAGRSWYCLVPWCLKRCSLCAALPAFNTKQDEFKKEVVVAKKGEQKKADKKVCVWVGWQ